jgi:hypothetical protein
MIEVIRVARTVSGTRAAADQLPDPGAVRLLQAAAFEAEGLPRLISDLLACYTEISCQEGADGGDSGYRFLDRDVRLIRIVSKAAGFRSGPDMRWTVGCIAELADHGRLIESGAAGDWHAAQPGGATSGQGGEVLRRLGRQHLVCGRLNPAQLRLAAPIRSTARLPSARLPPGAVHALSAISRDAAGGDSAWAQSSDALSGLGMTRGRAAQVLAAVGPLIVRAARKLRVSPGAEMMDQVERVPSIGESAGFVLALCDLMAINSLCDE